jgi:hypothetical protein
MIPTKENPAITEINPSRRRALKYLSAIIHSKPEKARVAVRAITVAGLSLSIPVKPQA